MDTNPDARSGNGNANRRRYPPQGGPQIAPENGEENGGLNS
jgi:hypothetical protein